MLRVWLDVCVIVVLFVIGEGEGDGDAIRLASAVADFTSSGAKRDKVCARMSSCCCHPAIVACKEAVMSFGCWSVFSVSISKLAVTWPSTLANLATTCFESASHK